MKVAILSVLLAVCCGNTCLCGAEPRSQADQLEAGFARPPHTAKPSIYWLWLNGYANREFMDHELKAFADLGIGGLCIFDMGARGDSKFFPPAGPAFMSHDSVEMIADAIKKAKKYGLDVQLAACSSWDLGGSWVTPQHASKALYHSQMRVEGPADLDTRFPFPKLPANVPRLENGKPAFLQEIAVLAFPETGSHKLLIKDRNGVINLTNRLASNGRLKWNVPRGRWTIIRFVCANTGERLKVPSPKSDGLVTDHFSAEATRTFVQTLIGRLQRKLGDDLNAAGIKQLYLPSYEVRGAIWTPDFLEQFKRYRGYDMTCYLPVLAGYRVESAERTERFLYDFQKTLGDLLVDAYYRTASATAREAGLGIEAEAGGPGPPVHQVPVDALKALGAIDEMRGEFWPWRSHRQELWVVKETACAAHVYGKRRVHMEAFTGFRHWQDGPFDLKPSADRAFCEGMNHVVWHTSSHQPPEAGKPGWVYGAGTHLTPNVVWWPMAKPFIQYLSRCSFMLQQGRFVADVCYYYGDQGANFVPPKHIDPSLGYGYDYDVANPEVILNRMTVREGRITLPDGMQYELLVLPARQDFDLAVLRKIEELVAQGATVVGPKPSRSNGLTDYPARDQHVKRIADKLWGACDGRTIRTNHYGKGTVVWGRPLREILRRRGIGPDFEFSSDLDDTNLDFLHRRVGDIDIYFVRNMKSRTESVRATFRVSGKAPEFWLPDSGIIHESPVYQETERGVRVPLVLEPYGSVFVVFRKPIHQWHLTDLDSGNTAERISDEQVRVTVFQNGQCRLRTADHRTIVFEADQISPPLTVKGPWRVRFPAGWGAPDSITMQNLVSWTRCADPGINHFSGMATYQTTLTVPESWLGHGRKVYLDLGSLWAAARVRLEGKSVGVLWKPPFRVDITNHVRAGENRLEIDVANTWANRLIGDAHLPADQRFCRTNITRSGTPAKPWKEIPLRESGLLGPVQVIPAVEKIVRISK